MHVKIENKNTGCMPISIFFLLISMKDHTLDIEVDDTKSSVLQYNYKCR